MPRTPQHNLASVIVDHLQDCVVVTFKPHSVIMNDVKQDRHIFRLEFLMLSSQVPHPDSASASSDCKHTLDEPNVICVNEPVFCGDRIVVPYQKPHTIRGTSLCVYSSDRLEERTGKECKSYLLLNTAGQHSQYLLGQQLAATRISTGSSIYFYFLFLFQFLSIGVKL
ncbi:hypothetical protein DEU56DRAFT_574223 [Suillus clintonianus]|uniref:uncharacterized protein n=1 Tax=Suillus clintonianus TaxID=1904413 RepID=UPI001B883CD8|nr:uncharacterized protein DEU56DRAFT_574223 [Suillus clintonianus]KAG2125415.1 hypothetical protein DEU56DRAFT_574223 [Suillus clintonianus]